HRSTSGSSALLLRHARARRWRWDVNVDGLAGLIATSGAGSDHRRRADAAEGDVSTAVAPEAAPKPISGWCGGGAGPTRRRGFGGDPAGAMGVAPGHYWCHSPS